ncbi:MAG: HIT domain-containing protein [Candidatus Lokiarchaeota archaeon]|nr:HIT domain-containing protein [Candidatus Lokiarchaeota archaeon]
MEKDNNLFKDNLHAVGKLKYVQDLKSSDINCILCEILADSEKVEVLKIYQDDTMAISLNLYPFNPGHLMIFPVRHIVDFRELTEPEIIRLSYLIAKCQDMLTEMYNPLGYNVGFNQGKAAGASIEHLHLHIVPRFKRELGYIDIIGKTRVLVEDVHSVYKKMKTLTPKYFDKNE